MTLAVIFKGPEGLVLAVDSRISITATLSATGEQFTSYFDNATKLFGIEGQPHVGVLTYGNNVIGMDSPRAVHGFMSEFEAKLSTERGHEANGGDRLKVQEIARELGQFYAEQWEKAAMPANSFPVFFLVAGFDEGEAYGRIFEVSVPSAINPVEHYAGPLFGVRWGGQSDLASRLMNGIDPRASAIAKDQLGLTDRQVQELEQKWSEELRLPIPWQFLPLQDCVDLATFLVSMTSAAQAWTFVGVRGVGGAADVATITRTQGFQAIRQKRIEVRDWH